MTNFTEALGHVEKALAENYDKVFKLKLVVRELLDAYDGGHVRMSSPDIGGSDDIPPHPWHEEWIHNAREALK